MNKEDLTIARTSNPDCPACVAQRLHKNEEWIKYHPDAAKGTSKEYSIKANKKDPNAA